MKPGLFNYFLKFDQIVDCVPYKERFLVNWLYTLSEPIDSTCIKRYEDTTLEGKLELEAMDRQIFCSQVNDHVL
jgi:hypothetical protein